MVAAPEMTHEKFFAYTRARACTHAAAAAFGLQRWVCVRMSLSVCLLYGWFAHSFSKPEQSELVFVELFVKRSPISEEPPSPSLPDTRAHAHT